MKKILLVLCICFCFCGCISESEKAQKLAKKLAIEEQQAQDIKNKYDNLKNKKILNIRYDNTTVDFILEDGSIITIYTYYGNVGTK